MQRRCWAEGGVAVAAVRSDQAVPSATCVARPLCLRRSAQDARVRWSPRAAPFHPGWCPTKTMTPTVTTSVIERASRGDEAAFRELTEPLRGELEFHCYRMLGSLHDAEDVLQETMLAAWRSLPSFEHRSSLRTWLYRIATNRCLNALRDASRRPPTPPIPPFPIPTPTRTADPHWLETYPEDRLGWLADHAPGPGGPLRDPRGGRDHLYRRAAASVRASAGGAGPPRCARLPRR